MHLDLKDLSSWSYAEIPADDAEQTQEDLALTFNKILHALLLITNTKIITLINILFIITLILMLM